MTDQSINQEPFDNQTPMEFNVDEVLTGDSSKEPNIDDMDPTAKSLIQEGEKRFSSNYSSPSTSSKISQTRIPSRITVCKICSKTENKCKCKRNYSKLKEVVETQPEENTKTPNTQSPAPVTTPQAANKPQPSVASSIQSEKIPESSSATASSEDILEDVDSEKIINIARRLASIGDIAAQNRILSGGDHDDVLKWSRQFIYDKFDGMDETEQAQFKKYVIQNGRVEEETESEEEVRILFDLKEANLNMLEPLKQQVIPAQPVAQKKGITFAPTNTTPDKGSRSIQGTGETSLPSKATHKAMVHQEDKDLYSMIARLDGRLVEVRDVLSHKIEIMTNILLDQEEEIKSIKADLTSVLAEMSLLSTNYNQLHDREQTLTRAVNNLTKIVSEPVYQNQACARPPPVSSPCVVVTSGPTKISCRSNAEALWSNYSGNQSLSVADVEDIIRIICSDDDTFRDLLKAMNLKSSNIDDIISGRAHLMQDIEQHAVTRLSVLFDQYIKSGKPKPASAKRYLTKSEDKIVPSASPESPQMCYQQPASVIQPTKKTGFDFTTLL